MSKGNKSPSKSPSKRPSKQPSTSCGYLNSDDGELLSGWEEDSGTEGAMGQKRYLQSLSDITINILKIFIFSIASKASTVFEGDDDDAVFMEDLATRWARSSFLS